MKIILKGDEKERKRQEMGIVECDWCHKEFAKKDTKFWPGGARVCFPCYDNASQEQDKIMKECYQEMRCRQETLENVGW